LLRGIALSPSNSFAELKYSIYLDAVNRPEDAVAHMRRALELDPLSFFMNRHLGSTLYFARHYDEALHYLQRAREMEPDKAAGFVEGWASGVYEKKGMQDEAVRCDLLALSNDHTPAEVNQLRSVYQRGGWKAYWQARTEALARCAGEQCDSYALALSYLRLGNRDLAFSWLNRSLDHRTIDMVFLQADPLLDDVRSDPRYHDLLRRMNLPD
jgi:tetratricopeptide (TPR) repeat protein